MTEKISTLILTFLFVASSLVFAQGPPSYSQLDPKPYNPETEPDIDMFIGSYKESMPHHTHGSLVERNIFTRSKGDPLHPYTKGAVLTYIDRFAYATLASHSSTTPTTLKGEQEIFYIDSGKGIIEAGNKKADLHEGVGILMPPGIGFIIKNTGNKSLTMYVMAESIPNDFEPRKDMLVRDENVIPLGSTNGHWCHIHKKLFAQKDGLANFYGMGPVWFEPMKMGQPHSHGEKIEEIWFVVKGDIHLLLGKKLRKLSPGSAYKIPPNGSVPHANINISDKTIKTFWLYSYEK